MLVFFEEQVDTDCPDVGVLKKKNPHLVIPTNDNHFLLFFFYGHIQAMAILGVLSFDKCLLRFSQEFLTEKRARTNV